MIRRHAFTLIEMLVVISLITLLLAMLQPSLRMAREEAKRAKCSSNLRQIMVATQAYVDTNQDFLPGAHTSGAAPEGVLVWMPRVREYASDVEEVFNCPTADPAYWWRQKFGSGLPARYGYAADEVRVANGSGRFTYGINDWGVNEFTNPHLGLGNHIDNGGNPGYQWGEVKASRILSPSDMIAFGDSTPDGVWDAVIDPNERPGFTREWPSDRHNGNCNIVFVDMHAEPIERDELLVRQGEPGDEERARRWNFDNQPHPEFWLPFVP